MHDTLGDPLVIEVRDLLAHDEVFEQRRPRAPARNVFWLSAMRTPWLVRNASPSGCLTVLVELTRLRAVGLRCGGRLAAGWSGVRHAGILVSIRSGAATCT
jgi:hypothetical protein